MVFLGACSHGSSGHVDTDQASQKNLAAVKDYYLTADIGGGWLVSNLQAVDGNIKGTLLMSSPEQACAFRGDSRSSLETTISNACPADGEKVWSQITPDRDIVLSVSCDGRVFYEHSCRAAHRKSQLGSTTDAQTDGLEAQATAGDPLAESRLGVMYSEGAGMPQDYKKAVELYEASARQGFQAAQDNLAGMYQDGQGVPTDAVLAYAWSTVSGSGTGQITRNQLAPQMKPRQIREAERLAAAWKKGQLIHH